MRSGTLGGFPSAFECWGDSDMIVRFGMGDAPASMVVNGEMQHEPCVKPFKVQGVTYELYRHPEHLVPDSIYSWVKRYEYFKRFGTRLEYDEQNPCFLEAVELYESIVRGFTDG